MMTPTTTTAPLLGEAAPKSEDVGAVGVSKNRSEDTTYTTSKATTTAATAPLLGEAAPKSGGVAAVGAVSKDTSEDTTCTTSECNALLLRHFPRYYFDAAEELFPCDINKYMNGQEEAPGCGGSTRIRADGTKWLIYINYFLRDGGIQVCNCPSPRCHVGDHQYDLEVVVVELDTEGAVSGVCYAPHGGYEHFWLRDEGDLAEILGGEGLRPIGYVSLGKHGSYPLSGRILRYFGFTNDHCDNPKESKYALIPLTEEATKLELIDDEFSGPATKMTHDWSLAKTSRLSEVRTQQFLPAWGQVGNFFDEICGCPNT